MHINKDFDVFIFSFAILINLILVVRVKYWQRTLFYVLEQSERLKWFPFTIIYSYNNIMKHV